MLFQHAGIVENQHEAVAHVGPSSVVQFADKITTPVVSHAVKEETLVLHGPARGSKIAGDLLARCLTILQETEQMQAIGRFLGRCAPAEKQAGQKTGGECCPETKKFSRGDRPARATNGGRGLHGNLTESLGNTLMHIWEIEAENMAWVRIGKEKIGGDMLMS